MLQAPLMTGRAPLPNGPSGPVDVRVVKTEPWIPQDEWQAGRAQDVELDCFVMITRKHQVNRRGLMRDGAQDVCI